MTSAPLDLFKTMCSSSQVFVETGTYKGGGVQQAYDAGFREIYSIEIREELFSEAKELFKDNPSVHLTRGDSGEHLWNIIKDIDKKITFWLDGHFCLAPSFYKGNYFDTFFPLMRELNIIKKHHRNDHNILIDDMDDWQKGSGGLAYGEEEIRAILLEINPNYIIKRTHQNGGADKILLAEV